MKIILEFDNVMKKYYPQQILILEIKDNGELQDLFQSIGRIKDSKLPESIWNDDENRFRGPVLITSGGRVLRDKKEKLFNGQRIELRRCVVGG
jgi:hypothetical protein